MEGFGIERELCSYIGNILDREKTDLIVCCERKATAIMRALIEDIDNPLSWNWGKVLSSVAVDQFDWVDFDGNKVLLFDELVHHGTTLNRHKKNIEDAVNKADRHDIQIVSASFAVWEGCISKPNYAYLSSVDAETYGKIREKIVAMLQEYGSLLLDTEHIELSVRLQCGMRDFYDTLARASEHGNSHSFVSAANRLNLTIGNPDIINDEAMQKCLLPGAKINDTVCKVRVVEKTHEKFSILPILYPNALCEFNENWASYLPNFMDSSYLRSAPSHVLFYHMSLLAAIELLRGVVAVLSELTHNQHAVLEIPKEKVEHLRSLFPRIDIERLWKYVSDVVSDAQRIRPRRGKQATGSLPIDEDKLFLLCGRVMNRMVLGYDDFPDGVSWKRLMQIATEENEKIGLDPRGITVVADRLIDNSLLVTGIKKLTSRTGDQYVIRTFSADGEVVSDRIRQQMMVRNPECLILT
jgi:hypothetical protein